MTAAPEVSVVIPTHNRPEQLRRCVESIVAGKPTSTFEIIVVNDGTESVPPSVVEQPRVRVLVSPGRGPATARNIGIAAARAPITVFADDDVIAQGAWLDTLTRALRHGDAVGVAGTVTCPPHDRLYARAVSTGGGSHGYLTCNIAYRTAVLRAVGGLDEAFPYAHGEDLDLRELMARHGAIEFCASAEVIHPAHPFTIVESMRRMRLIRSDWYLYAKHPDLKPGHRPLRWTPLFVTLHLWTRLFRREHVWRTSPRRMLRFTLLAVGQSLAALWITIRYRPTPRQP